MSYVWPEFPPARVQQFNQKARTALETWRQNAMALETRLGNVEGYLSSNSDFSPNQTHFNELVWKTFESRNPLAKSIYLDPVSGSDSNDGTSGAPLATLEEAIDRIPVSGMGTILVKSGTTISLQNVRYVVFNKYVRLARWGDSNYTITSEYVDAGSYAQMKHIRLDNSCFQVWHCTVDLPQNNTGKPVQFTYRGLFTSGYYTPLSMLTFGAGGPIKINHTDNYFFEVITYAPGAIALGISTTIDVNADGWLADFRNVPVSFFWGGGTTAIDSSVTGKSTIQDLIQGVLYDTDNKPRNVISNVIF